MPTIQFDTQTAIYNAPAFGLYKPPAATGTSVPANVAPDSGNTTELVVPLLLTAYSAPSAKPTVQPVTMTPLIEPISNTAYGGYTLSEGIKSLPKISLEGHIDTPMIDQTIAGTGTDMNRTKFRVPALTIDGIRHTFIEYIVLLMEGRARFIGHWIQVHPWWFRDPYGRVFNSPRIVDITAGHVESVPGRTNFTMQLIVPGPVVT